MLIELSAIHSQKIIFFDFCSLNSNIQCCLEYYGMFAPSRPKALARRGLTVKMASRVELLFFLIIISFSCLCIFMVMVRNNSKTDKILG